MKLKLLRFYHLDSVGALTPGYSMKHANYHLPSGTITLSKANELVDAMMLEKARPFGFGAPVPRYKTRKDAENAVMIKLREKRIQILPDADKPGG